MEFYKWFLIIAIAITLGCEEKESQKIILYATLN